MEWPLRLNNKLLDKGMTEVKENTLSIARQ